MDPSAGGPRPALHRMGDCPEPRPNARPFLFATGRPWPSRATDRGRPGVDPQSRDMAHASGLIAIVLSLLAGADPDDVDPPRARGDHGRELEHPLRQSRGRPHRLAEGEAVIDHLEAGGIDVIGLQGPAAPPGDSGGPPRIEAFARSRERDVRRGRPPILWRRDRWRIDPGNSSHLVEETRTCGVDVVEHRAHPNGDCRPIKPAGSGKVPRRPIWVNVHLDPKADARLNAGPATHRRPGATHPGNRSW